MDLETKLRLAEIPKLIEIEGRALADIAAKIGTLEAEREARMTIVRELQTEELMLLRAAK